MKTEELLKIEHVSKTFSGRSKSKIYAVRDVSLSVKKGECLGILGESGCGKSTLAKMVVGIHSVDQGFSKIRFLRSVRV